MTWLDSKKVSMLHQWMEKTAVPMYAASVEGEILWCNSSFENLTGYTVYELTSGQRTWGELTSCPEDKEAEEDALTAVVLGTRDSYKMNKALRSKDGVEVSVIAHTMRYPNTGELECLLVSIIPLNAGSKYQVETMSDVHRLLIEMASREREHAFDKFFSWVAANQWKAGIAGCVLLAYFLGEDFIYALKSVFEAFRGIPSQPPQ